MASLLSGSPADPVSDAPAEPPSHLILGGNGISALGDSLQADAASRLLLHCCTARDSVFSLDLPNVFGLFTPASLYTGPVLRTMALRGTKRVAVAYNRDDPLHVQLCEGALRQLPPLGELRPGFGSVVMLNYTQAEAGTDAFWQAASAAIASANADALVACDDMSRTSRLVRNLRASGRHLSAVWLASWGDVGDFLTYLDGHGEYALTTVQWMPSLPYADADFGTASDYAQAFQNATGRTPSYFSAAATATGSVLLSAIKRVVSLCSLEGVAASTWASAADSFMWQEGVLACHGIPQRSFGLHTNGSGAGAGALTGSDAVRYVLGTLELETFYGPVSFNGLRQNIHHPAAVAQVFNGQLVTVLPLDVAEKALVMPIPEPAPPRAPWASTPAGIAILVLSCCLGAVCLALASLACSRRLPQHLSVAKAVAVDLEEIEVDFPPSVNADGSFEPGEGMYRGTRVKLVVAEELMPPANAAKAPRAAQQGVPLVPTPAILYEERDLSLVRSPGRASLTLNGRLLGAAGVALEDGHAEHDIADAGLAAAAAEAGAQPGLAPRRSGAGLLPPERRLYRKQSTTSELMTSSFGVQGATVLCSTPSAASPFPGTGGTKYSPRKALGMVWRGMRLHHPSICPVFGVVWEWPGVLEGGGSAPVLLRQWQEFDSLDRLLENETVGLPLVTKAAIAHGIAEGIAYLHAQKPPIVAGPLEVRRIVISKDFSPRIFLRLNHLDEAYGTEPLPASRSGSRLQSLFKSRTTLTEMAPSAAPAPAPLRSLSPAGASAALSIPAALPRLTIETACVQRSIEGQAPIVSGNASGMGQSPTAHGENGLMPFAHSSATQIGSPAPQYCPSREQDVHDFGILLCLIFSTRMRANSSRLSTVLPLVPGARESVISAGPISSAALQPASRQSGLQQQQHEEQTVDLDAALDELSEVSPELSALARACLQVEGRPTAAAVATFLATCVLPSFGAAAAGGGVGAVGRGSRINLASPFRGGRSGGQRPGSSEHQPLSMTLQRMGSQASIASIEPVLPEGAKSPAMHGRSFRITGCGRARGNHAGFTPDDLIFDIFPPKVARALQAGEAVQPERYDMVSIFFSDVVGYTELCAQLQPHEVMDLLHRLYSRFDDLIRSMWLFKVETVGDAYLAVSNLRWQQPDCHARLMAQFAFEAVRAANSLPVHPERPELGLVHIRVGLHCGPVVGSVVGTLNRRFCLFGDAVNTAARMEHESKVDRVHCSGAFAAALREQWPQGAALISRGVRQIKGKGPMETFWVVEQSHAAHVEPERPASTPAASVAAIQDAVSTSQ